jgi:hypothetical protein
VAHLSVIALSINGGIKTLGSYAGLAAVVALALLALLYFAQARELKRLREWIEREAQRPRARSCTGSTARGPASTRFAGAARHRRRVDPGDAIGRFDSRGGSARAASRRRRRRCGRHGCHAWWRCCS